MVDVINIRLAFDVDASVWYVEASDVHGLRLEGATADELMARIPGAIQDLLEEAGAPREVSLNIVAHRETSVQLEAA
jgi:hypothetical protein